MAVHKIALEQGPLKKVWLSKYFNFALNPNRDPHAPAWIVESAGKRYRGFHAVEVDGVGEYIFDPTLPDGPYGYKETDAQIVLEWDDAWPEGGPEIREEEHGDEEDE